MAFTITEKADSRVQERGRNPRATFRFDVRSDEALAAETAEELAEEALLADAGVPLAYRGMPLANVRLEEVVVPLRHYVFEVEYALSGFSAPEVGDSTYSFEVASATEKLLFNWRGETEWYGPAGSDPPNPFKAIGATEDSIEGVDVVVPVFSFSERHIMAAADVTTEYKAALFNLTGRLNEESFRGYAAGEVMFMGASGEKRNDDDWEITFRFAVKPNREDVVVGDPEDSDGRIDIEDLGGWQHLWVRSVDAESEGVLMKKPIAAYVETLYESADFSGLGVG